MNGKVTERTYSRCFIPRGSSLKPGQVVYATRAEAWSEATAFSQTHPTCSAPTQYPSKPPNVCHVPHSIPGYPTSKRFTWSTTGDGTRNALVGLTEDEAKEWMLIWVSRGGRELRTES